MNFYFTSTRELQRCGACIAGLAAFELAARPDTFCCRIDVRLLNWEDFQRYFSWYVHMKASQLYLLSEAQLAAILTKLATEEALKPQCSYYLRRLPFRNHNTSWQRHMLEGIAEYCVTKKAAEFMLDTLQNMLIGELR